MATLLYYPLVNPPDEILYQALLYWDGVASLVPWDHDVAEIAVSRHMRDLEQRGLYSPVVFRDVQELRGEDRRAWEREMERIVDRLRPSDPFDHFLYRGKTDDRLIAKLVRAGLAEEMPDNVRFAVSAEVQHLVVGAAVRSVATRHDRSYVPFTDRAAAHRLALEPVRRGAGLAWEMEIGGLLPLPVPGTPMERVIAFREQYRDERERLMRAIHRLLGDLRRDYEHPADVLAQVNRELTQAVDDLKAAARGSRLVWLRRSVTVAVALGAAATGAMLVPEVGWLLGVVSGYAINVATREIRPVPAPVDDFSYLQRVREQLT